jgi:hypothetical protein
MAQMINGIFPGTLLPDAILGGSIAVYEKAWPNPQETIELLEQECSNPESGMSWSRATTYGAGPFQSHRTNYSLSITDTALIADNMFAQNLHTQMNILLLASTLPYAARFGIQDALHHEGYNALRYRGEQEYKQHYDGGSLNGRVLSAIVYLNDDYKGGELEFVNFKIKIKPEPGMLILFPSNYAYSHIAHPIEDKTKYALVTWIRDRPLGV